MRFLFINPNRNISSTSIWSLVSSVTPPLGLATLAAVLENNGFESDIIDAQAMNLSHSDLSIYLNKTGPYNYIGITATTPEISSAIRVAEIVRSLFPMAKIIIGGVHATVFHEQLVNQGFFDIAVRGEGERVLVDLAKEKSLHTIENITWRNDAGSVIVNASASTYIDLDLLPNPAYHKLPMHLYRSALGAAIRHPSIGMITSRGCPGSCSFCFSGMFGKKIRFLSASKIIEHIEMLYINYGIREISFYDDTFTANKARVIEFCELLIRKDFKMSWSCFARIDTVTLDLLQLMKAAGCHQIMYGFESSDNSVLTKINKKVSVNSYHQVIAWTNQAGINIRGAFMIGNPGESQESIRRTIDFSIKSGIALAIYNITTPFPGTELYAWAEGNGALKHKNWDLYDLAHPIIAINDLSEDIIISFYRRAYRKFYLRPTILFSITKLLSFNTIIEYLKLIFMRLKSINN